MRFAPFLCLAILFACCAASDEQLDGKSVQVVITYTDGSQETKSIKANTIDLSGNGCLEINYHNVACGVRSYKVIK